ncbi:DUF2062 domain-containing protein [Aliidiomarina taiwanensis]|uniref:DUF2062 domain-containing protein n=1 Tax=Aliidiomarina taiwanensis TaxID=946228 RepID=A0A432X1G1_9GAMM|nr:TIGR03546 family protein [Aliidiomarina taiwanensis]RUO40102.1 DUF2062 domain-containing protein [Aliidiomarina taiwanensis]
MLGVLAKLLKALNSETSAWALATGIALGMVVGFTPLWSVHNLFILFVVLAFRVNVSFFLLSFTLASGLAYLLDPAFNYVGEYLLTSQSLLGLWQSLYEVPLARIMQFNHTISLGSLVIALILFIPVLLIARFIVNNYRSHIQARIARLPLVNVIKGTRFWAIYQKISAVKVGGQS